METWRKSFFYIFLMVCVAVIATANPAAAGDDQLRGFVDSFGYGYAVSVSVNGTPVKVITGDGQQATRLFGTDHPMRAQSPPEMADLFILREGENTIIVEFQKKEDSQNPLQVKLEVPDRYSQPLFHLTSSGRASGKVEKKIIIEKKQPPDFKTIVVNDDTM